MTFRKVVLLAVGFLYLPFLFAQNVAVAQQERGSSARQTANGNSGKATAPGHQQPTFTTRDLVSRVRKSLVLISTQDREGKDVAEASGFFIAPQLVATNLHVLKWASEGYIKSADDGKRFKIAAVTAFSLNHDVCILYVPDAVGIPLRKASDPVAVGDDILVAGNPEGLEATFSTGIVSGIRAEAGLLQIDAPISHGSSGGPVVNRRGEAVGLAVSSLVSGQNLNFAVPIQFLSDRMIGRRMTASAAGHLAVTDREDEGFHGPVQSFTQKQSVYSLNEATGSYVEGAVLTTESETFDVNGRLKVSKQFSEGSETGSVIREYSQDGLELREIAVNSQGAQQVQELQSDEQMNVQASRIHYDETLEEGTKGTPKYDTCKFNDFGQRSECFIPVQGTRYVMKYDENGRETDWFVYMGETLRGKTHFTYEGNAYGDWTVQHATFWNSTKPDLGFIALGETYRTISYFGSNNE
jgi:hypothetical protein